MLASLPDEIQRVFERFITTEYVTIDRRGQPIAWPVTPYVDPGGRCLDVTTGLGYPKKARDAERNPHVALLFSDATGSGLERPPMVLVQGTASVDDADLEANRARYERESEIKLPVTKEISPPKPVRRWLTWYYARIYVHVRPERVFAWPAGDLTAEPELFLADQAEVRSGHPEAPAVDHHEPDGGACTWDDRLDGVREGVVAIEAPDGWPFAARVALAGDRAARRLRVLTEPSGAPLLPGLACVTVHSHAPDFRWQRNFQVRGDLARDEQGWYLAPHRLVGGIELPEKPLDRLRDGLRQTMRYRATAKRELAARR